MTTEKKHLPITAEGLPVYLSAATDLRDDAGRQIAHWQRLQQNMAGLVHALDRLKCSWRDLDDPGRHQQFWFAVRNLEIVPQPGVSRVTLCDWFFIEEFLDDPEAARQAIPPNRLGKFAETFHVPVSDHQEEDPVLGCYQLADEDTRAGDHWVLDIFVLCRHMWFHHLALASGEKSFLKSFPSR